MTHCVMLVDANAFNGNLISKLITMRGWKAIVVEHADQALSEAKAHQPDLVIVNVGGRGRREERFARLARQETCLRTTPLVAMTDHPMERHNLKRRYPLYDEWITMPFSVVDFQNKLDALLL